MSKKPDSSNAQVDLQIGPYKMDRTIGQGTYGKVRLAVNVVTDEKVLYLILKIKNSPIVAVKVIEKSQIQSPKQIARLQREIRFLKLLHHPHIVKVFDVVETAEYIYIVMEYAAGGELFDYIVAHKRVKEKEARSFFRMVLSAVDYCHQNSIIHRDLKPENLLLDDQKCIKIIDFGFGNNFATNNLLDTFCGSPFYAAPEMILGKKYEGPEVDMWSLGVILFALLCGHLPFDDDNMKELYKKIATGTYTIPDYLLPEARHLIGRLITVDPKKRATLKEVLSHPWVNQGYDQPPANYLPERPYLDSGSLSLEIISRLKTFGYTEAEIYKAFDEEDQSQPNPIRAQYFLLIEMLRREEAKMRSEQRKRSLFISRQLQSNSTLSMHSSPSITNNDLISAGITTSALTIQTPNSTSTSLNAIDEYLHEKPGGRDLLDTKVSKGTSAAEKSPIFNKNQFFSMQNITSERRVSSPDSAKTASNRTITRISPPKNPTTFSADQVNSTKLPKPTIVDERYKLKDHRKDSVTSPEVKSADSAIPSSSVTKNITAAISSYASRRFSSPGMQVSASTSLGKNQSSLREELRAVSGWFLNVSTTSSKSPQEIIDEIIEVLTQNDILYEFDVSGNYTITCDVDVNRFLYAGTEQGGVNHNIQGQISLFNIAKASDNSSGAGELSNPRRPSTVNVKPNVVFQIEVCKVPKMTGIHGLHFKRLNGASASVHDEALNVTASITEANALEEETHALFVRAVIMLVLILIAMHINGFLHYKKFHYLGESAVTIILGLFVTTMWRLIDSSTSTNIQLSSKFFYMFLLPPIIFEGGFTLHRAAFFRNITSILALAFFGALYSTMVTSILMYFFSKLTDPGWSFVESLVFGSLISSTDPITVLSLLPSNVDKNLYMLIFGESALNDAVSIILYRFFTALADPKMRLDPGSLFVLVIQSAGVFIGSFVVGVGTALLFALIMKHVRVMHDQPVYEATMLLILAYISYLIADIMGLTGIISIFFCGIAMAHYSYDTLSEQTKSTVKMMLRFLSGMCDTFIFLYLGLGLLSFGEKTVYQPALVGLAFLSIIISRSHVFILLGLGWILPGGQKVPWNQTTLIWFSGLRGAVAFALGVTFLEHPVFDPVIKGQVFGTSVMVVILTVLIFGGLTPYMLRWLKIVTPDQMEDGHGVEHGEVGDKSEKKLNEVANLDPEKQAPLSPDELHLSPPPKERKPSAKPPIVEEDTPTTADLQKPIINWLYNFDNKYIRPHVSNGNIPGKQESLSSPTTPSTKHTSGHGALARMQEIQAEAVISPIVEDNMKLKAHPTTTKIESDQDMQHFLADDEESDTARLIPGISGVKSRPQESYYDLLTTTSTLTSTPIPTPSPPDCLQASQPCDSLLNTPICISESAFGLCIAGAWYIQQCDETQICATTDNGTLCLSKDIFSGNPPTYCKAPPTEAFQIDQTQSASNNDSSINTAATTTSDTTTFIVETSIVETETIYNSAVFTRAPLSASASVYATNSSFSTLLNTTDTAITTESSDSKSFSNTTDSTAPDSSVTPTPSNQIGIQPYSVAFVLLWQAADMFVTKVSFIIPHEKSNDWVLSWKMPNSQQITNIKHGTWTNTTIDEFWSLIEVVPILDTEYSEAYISTASNNTFINPLMNTTSDNTVFVTAFFHFQAIFTDSLVLTPEEGVSLTFKIPEEDAVVVETASDSFSSPTLTTSNHQVLETQTTLINTTIKIENNTETSTLLDSSKTTVIANLTNSSIVAPILNIRPAIGVSASYEKQSYGIDTVLRSIQNNAPDSNGSPDTSSSTSSDAVNPNTQKTSQILDARSTSIAIGVGGGMFAVCLGWVTLQFIMKYRKAELDLQKKSTELEGGEKSASTEKIPPLEPVKTVATARSPKWAFDGETADFVDDLQWDVSATTSTSRKQKPIKKYQNKRVLYTIEESDE
ncbi:hypothetical protein HK098_005561 [Nowakowskiella sp. JEL0407]|nr:hypothetical protein HK098_005561 [Nowakowskiella sp. JEL0407]